MGLRIKITIWEKVRDGSCKERKMRNEFNNLILYVLITSIIQPGYDFRVCIQL